MCYALLSNSQLWNQVLSATSLVHYYDLISLFQATNPELYGLKASRYSKKIILFFFTSRKSINYVNKTAIATCLSLEVSNNFWFLLQHNLFKHLSMTISIEKFALKEKRITFNYFRLDWTLSFWLYCCWNERRFM